MSTSGYGLQINAQPSSNAVFTGAAAYDVNIYPVASTQNILIGTRSNALPALTVSGSNVGVRKMNPTYGFEAPVSSVLGTQLYVFPDATYGAGSATTPFYMPLIGYSTAGNNIRLGPLAKLTLSLTSPGTDVASTYEIVVVGLSPSFGYTGTRVYATLYGTAASAFGVDIVPYQTGTAGQAGSYMTVYIKVQTGNGLFMRGTVATLFNTCDMYFTGAASSTTPAGTAKTSLLSGATTPATTATFV